MSLPPEWELSAYDGDFRAGYARLDDGVQIRLQVQWKQERRPVTSLEPALERYRKALTRKLGRSVAFEMLDATALTGASTRRCLAYSWTGKHAATGMAAFCPECGRVTFTEVFSGTPKASLKLAQEVLPTLLDHGRDGLLPWCVYGFGFRVPTDYALAQPTLLPGRLQFAFRAAHGRWLRVERWTLASPALEALPLDAWPRELLAAARLQPRDVIATTSEKVDVLEACSFETRVSLGLFRRTEVRGIAWRDPVQRKVFAVIAGREPMELVRGLAEDIRCY